MKFFRLTLLLVVSIAMLTGCGGGGSSNPAAATADPLTDYPTISAAYVTMVTDMTDNTADPVARVNSFMANISSEFKNIAGTGDKYNDLKTVTQSRLERYNFNKYALTPTSHTVIDANTVKVTTTMLVNVALKDGKTGNAPQNTDIYLNDVSITWVNDAGTWKIYQGLPYTSDEYWGLSD